MNYFQGVGYSMR